MLYLKKNSCTAIQESVVSPGWIQAQRKPMIKCLQHDKLALQHYKFTSDLIIIIVLVWCW